MIGRRIGALVGLAMVVSSCAPLPPPIPVPTPSRPAPPESPPATAPSQPPAAAPQAEPWISIGLAWNLDAVELDPVGAATIEGPVPGALEAEASLAVSLDHGQVVATSVGSRQPWRAKLEPKDTLWLAGSDGPPQSPVRLIRWAGKSWRGRFKLFQNPRGKLTLVTVLPLETYLLGVVPGEIGALDEALVEAGRAQAIAARSYTLFYRGRRAAEGFDLYGTVEDQLYGPVENERPLATRCVESTSGRVALFQGGPIRANYGSTCGGITAEVWEAWPADPLPYLVSQRDRGGSGDFCEASRHHRWREEWTVAEFAADLARFGPTYGVRLPPGGVGEVVDVRVASRSRSGRVWLLDVITSRGRVAIPAYSLRQVLRRPGKPESILRSNLFKIEVRRDPRTRRALAVVASGAGSGHGVGLCQTGALGMARAGRSGEHILEHYYPGIEIRAQY
ncbi:MAG TPA: SpoIID/LytB domain-containing protein [Candidatus Eisenbacteria bacterium]